MAKNRAVAIDIGTHTAKIVQLEQSGTAVQLTYAGTVTYTDKVDRHHVAAAVKQLWDAVGAPAMQTGLLSVFNRDNTEIALALPRAFVNTKRLPNLPAATDDQLANIVAIAAETELPFRIDEAIFTYHDVQRSADSTDVELISTRRTTVTDYLDLLEQHSITASAVTPSMLAIAEVALQTGSTQPTCIVDIGAEQTDFCLIQDGKLRFSRSFRHAGDHLSADIANALNIDTDGAETEKQQLSAREETAAPWTARLIAEIGRSIQAATVNVEAAQNAVSETDLTLRLCGGGARLLDLAPVCEAELGIPTQLWNPFHALQRSAEIETNSLQPAVQQTCEAAGDTLAVAFGAALAALKESEMPSLLPKETAETLTQNARQRQLFAAAGLGALILIAIFFAGYTLQRAQHYRNERVAAKLASYTLPLADAKARLAKELVLTDMLAHHVSPLDILHSLSALFGDRTQVAWTNFNITNLHDPTTARITFNLESNSHNAINTLLRTLDRSGIFTNVRPGEVTTVSQDRKEVFQVQVRCNLEAAAVRMFAKKRYPNFELPAEPPPADDDLSIGPPTADTLETEEE